MRIRFWWFLISFSNISLYWHNYRISAHVAFSGYILVFRQLQEFVSMSIFKHLRTFVTNQDFMIRWNINKIENINKLYFYNLKIIKIITALRTQNIYIICSYNIDLTRNAGNCLFKMLENKPSIFFNLTDRMWNCLYFTLL